MPDDLACNNQWGNKLTKEESGVKEQERRAKLPAAHALTPGVVE